MKDANKPMNISFVPSEGEISNYFDCKVITPDGSIWESRNNHWRKERIKIAGRKKPEESNANHMIGILGFSLGMVFFAHPVEITFGFDNPSGWIVLIWLCSFCAAVFAYLESK